MLAAGEASRVRDARTYHPASRVDVRAYLVMAYGCGRALDHQIEGRPGLMTVAYPTWGPVGDRGCRQVGESDLVRRRIERWAVPENMTVSCGHAGQALDGKGRGSRARLGIDNGTAGPENHVLTPWKQCWR